MKIAFNQMGGIAPKIDPRLLAPNMGQVAQNIRFGSDDLRPYNNPSTITTPTQAGTLISMYRFGISQTNLANYWFAWPYDVDAARSPIAGDTTERTYFSSASNAPQVTNSSLALTGGTNYPMASYNLGIPAPINAPTVGVGAQTPGSGSLQYVSYCTTLVDAWGEESAPSPFSAPVAVNVGQGCTIGGLSLYVGAGYQAATAINIYRSVTSSATGTTQMYYLTQVTSTSNYIDNFSLSIGYPIATTGWLPPPSNLTGLQLHPAGFLFGQSGNVLCLSALDAVYATSWPVG